LAGQKRSHSPALVVAAEQARKSLLFERGDDRRNQICSGLNYPLDGGNGLLARLRDLGCNRVRPMSSPDGTTSITSPIAFAVCASTTSAVNSICMAR
jgi:hypothetical protein